jgi:hypothetical protein
MTDEAPTPDPLMPDVLLRGPEDPPLSPDPPAPPGQEDLKVPDLPLPMSSDQQVHDEKESDAGEAPD